MINTIVPEINRIPLPASLGFLQPLQIVFFILHIVPMNLLVGGSLIILFSGFFGAQSENQKKLSKSIIEILPVVMAYVVLFGVATLLFTQVIYAQFFYTSSILIAVPWISVIVLVILGYYGLYVRLWKLQKFINPLVALIFLIVMSIYVSNVLLMLNPHKWTTMYFKNPYGLNFYINDITFVPRYLHFILSSVAVSGLFIVWYGILSKKEETERKWVVNYGLSLFVFPTLLQFIIGIWFLLSLPLPILKSFVFGNFFNSIILCLGVLFGLVSMLLFLSARNKKTPQGLIIFGSIFIFLTIILMVITRHNIRHEYLCVYLIPTREVNIQSGPILLFLFTLIFGMSAIVFILKKIMPSMNKKIEC